MPIVPGVPERSVSPDNLPNARLSPDAFGADVSAPLQRGVEANANAAASATFEAKKQADQVAHLEAATTYGSFANQAAAAFKQKQGKDAGAAYPDAMKSFDEQAQEVSKGLTNDTQRNAFNATVAQHKLSFQNFALNHIAGEAEQFDKTQTALGISNAEQAATLQADNFDVVGAQVENQKQLVKQAMDRNSPGYTPDMLKGATAPVISSTHAAVVTELMDQKKTDIARQYFDAHRDEIMSPARGQLEKGFAVSDTQDQARAIADTITGNASLEGPSPTEEQAYAALEKEGIKSTQVYDQARNRITEFYRHQEEAYQSDQRHTLRQAMNVADTSPNGMADVPPSLLAKLDFEHREPFDRYATQVAKQEFTANDEHTYNRLMALSANAPDGFMRVSMDTERANLTPEHFAHFVGLQTKMAEEKAKVTADRSGTLVNKLETEQAVFEQGVSSLKIKPTGVDPNGGGKVYGEQDAKVVADLREKLGKATDAWLKDNPKKTLTPEVTREIMNRLLVQVPVFQPPLSWADKLVPGKFLWDQGFRTKTTPLFQSDFANVIATTPSEIPPKTRASIEADLRRQNIVASDEAVLGIYNKPRIVLEQAKRQKAADLGRPYAAP